ncbi:MAG TPA: hypothetical protein VFL76_00585 [Edaphocola sp.]|nr:hypothetical protein [Edaphocola sp.]
MDSITTGFIGGCINHQPGISRSHLYHAIVMERLGQDQNNKNYRVALGRYLSYDQLVPEAEAFIFKKKPGHIFLFIRPFPVMPLQKLLVKYERADGRQTRAFHPALLTRKLAWNERLTKFQTERDFIFTPRKKIGLRDCNLMAGVVLGLHHWTRRYIAKQIHLTKQLCRQHDIQLSIISPPQNPESAIGNLTCKWLTGFLGRYCRQEQLGFININSFSIDNFEPDGIHFNIHGHRKLAELIYAVLSTPG